MCKKKKGNQKETGKTEAACLENAFAFDMTSVQ